MASDILELLADTKDGVYAVDMDQRIVFWNKGAERILGYTSDEVLGQRCHYLMGGLAEDHTRVCTAQCAAIMLARRGRIMPSHNVLTKAKDGQPRWVSITHVVLPAPHVEFSTLVHIFHDVSQEVEAKRLLRQLRGILSSDALPAPTVSTAPAEPVAAGETGLTGREMEVLRLMASGLGTKAIAEHLVVSPTTVRNHIQRVLTKLGVHTRLEAVAAASRQGLT